MSGICFEKGAERIIMLEKVKCIIWDLDETFWQGTLSEGAVYVPERIALLLRHLTDAGIVNSICSKNDYGKTKRELEKNNLWEFFVFPSIDWLPKGSRVKNIIQNMKLRPENILFLDDNLQNLEEAKHFCPGILTGTPDIIPDLCNEAEKIPKKDKNHKRLNQYITLQAKETAKQDFESNEEFLKACNIRVQIENDCQKNIERIHELLARSNQLNYTKYRASIEELREMINDSTVECGYVQVRDKFGDYGIIGFYAIKDGEAIHYAFSCRTLGMLVEQYVYMTVGCPHIDIQGEVVTQLNDTFLPPWINQKEKATQSNYDKYVTNNKVLFKGPCDMQLIFSYIKPSSDIVTEFSYVNDKGTYVEGHNVTSSIVTAMNITEDRVREILDELPFADEGMFKTAIGKEPFHFIVLSMIPEAVLRVYRRKSTGDCISLCGTNLTNPGNYERIVNKKCYTANINFTYTMLEKFAGNYEWVDLRQFDRTIQNLTEIRNRISNGCKLVLLLGSEREFDPNVKPTEHQYSQLYRILNKKIREWKKGKDNVEIVHIDDFITSENDFRGSINHFSNQVYYNMAMHLINLFSIEECNIRIKNKNDIYFMKQKKRLIKQITKHKKLYSFLKKIKKKLNNR